MAGVALKNLTKQFDGKKVVDNLSLEVASGEFICLLGEPGAGKTTTLRMIAGLEAPDSGEVYIDDVLVNDLEPRSRDVAMTFQSYALYPHLKVYENLAYPLRRRKAEVDKRVREVAELLRITDILDKKPGLCSGGERQRVAIGRTLVRRPKLYLFDEPLTNLDAKLRLHMRTELKKIQREVGQTAIFTTPDEVEAMAIADKIVVMREGRLLQYDTNREVYGHPASLYVATLIGTPPMNVVDCSLEEADGEAYLDSGVFKVNVTKNRSTIRSQATSSELLLGVRPPDVGVEKVKRGKESFEASVFIKEPSGVDTILDLKIGDIIVKAKVPHTATFNVGDRVWLGFADDRIHVIDKRTERVIY
jgi:multiple sugar transport system ATP-binding protein